MIARGRLPLGIDVGRACVRIAELVNDSAGPHLRRLHTRTLERSPADDRHLGLLISDVLRAAKVAERRCVFSIGEPEATVRSVTFPRMPTGERERAARFEASRFVDYPPVEAWVRTRAIDATAGLYALGILRRARLRSLLEIARAARLRLVAVDHESFALRRSAPHADAILDIGHLSARLYVFGSATPFGAVIEGGAQAFTHAIARSLAVDIPTAERRKRTIGLAGSASGEVAAFAQSVGRAMLSVRAQGAPSVQRIVLVGGGARLHGIAERLEKDTGCAVEVSASVGVDRSGYPEDVVRAGAPEWSLSIGLGLWTLSARLAA